MELIYWWYIVAGIFIITWPIGDWLIAGTLIAGGIILVINDYICDKIYNE